jgi:hypothetical protein
MSWRTTADIRASGKTFDALADEMAVKLDPDESVLLVCDAGKVTCGFTTLQGRLTVVMITTKRFCATAKSLYFGRMKELDIPIAEIGDGIVHRGAKQLLTRYSCKVRRGTELTIYLALPDDADAVGRACVQATSR